MTRLIKKSEPCPSPHPQPPKPKCVLLGYAAASVQNKEDRFHNATAIIDAKDPHKGISGYYPLTYSLFKPNSNSNLLALIIPIWENLEVKCDTHANTCPTPEKPHIFSMKGKAMMRLQLSHNELKTAIVAFTFKVWVYGISQTVQMITKAEDNIFNHNSGIMKVTQGNLRIKTGFTETTTSNYENQ